MIGPGMDHTLYGFSPITDRASFRLPDGKPLAVCPVVYAEEWALEPPPDALSDPRFADPYGRFHPDYRTHSWREYGLRVGIFRLFELFDAYGLKATLAANAAVVRRCPQIVESALRRGWEIVGHGDIANQMITSRMARDEVRGQVEAALDTIEAATAIRPRGWIGQDFGESVETPSVLAEAGLTWVADWPNDEQPYLLATDPPLLSVPVLSELDDVQLLWHRRVPTWSYPNLVSEARSVLVRDGAASARVMVLGLHAWLFGMPHRIGYLDTALRDLARDARVWHTPIGPFADFALTHFMKERPT